MDNNQLAFLAFLAFRRLRPLPLGASLMTGAAAFLATAPVAHAQIGYYVRATAGTTLTGNDTGYVYNGPKQLTATTSEGNATGSSANATATARMGSLSAFAHSFSPSLSPQQFYTGINALASTEFSDYIRITGPGGGNLLVTFGLNLDGSFVNTSPLIRSGASARTSFWVIGGGVNQVAVLDWNALNAAPTGTSSITALIPYNTDIRILGSLSTNVGIVSGTGINQSITATADFAHTATFYITPAEPSTPTSSFALTSSSGNQYAVGSAAAAPEPATLSLLFLGSLPVAGAVLRRHRNRR